MPSLSEIAVAVLAGREIEREEGDELRTAVLRVVPAVRAGASMTQADTSILRAAAAIADFGRAGKSAKEYDATDRDFACVGMKNPSTGEKIGSETALNHLEHHLLKRVALDGWPKDMRPFDYLKLAREVVLAADSSGYTGTALGSNEPMLAVLRPRPRGGLSTSLGSTLLVMYTLQERRMKTLYDTDDEILDSNAFHKVVKRW